MSGGRAPCAATSADRECVDQFIRLGKVGYRAIMMNLTRTADYLAACLEQLGFLILR